LKLPTPKFGKKVKTPDTSPNPSYRQDISSKAPLNSPNGGDMINYEKN
jgi:hypothetical protein